MKLSSCHPHRKHKAKGLCGSCYDKHLKSINIEYKNNQRKNLDAWYNKPENKEKIKLYKQTRRLKELNDPFHKLKRRDRALRQTYGITLNDYNNMLLSQNNKCALCFRLQGSSTFHVDHCHNTGRVRGILCHQCNWYLGIVDQDVSILERIKDYISKTT